MFYIWDCITQKIYPEDYIFFRKQLTKNSKTRQKGIFCLEGQGVGSQEERKSQDIWRRGEGTVYKYLMANDLSGMREVSLRCT